MSSRRPHFLVFTYPLQGHIAPALRLARRLLAVAPDVLVTFSTTIAAHSRMFPAAKSTDDVECGAEEEDGRLEFHPFSDGTKGGYAGGGSGSGSGSGDVAEFNAYMASFHAAGARSAGEIVDALAARGRPVSRVVYTLMLPWAADVARERGVASALYWIQPVLVLAIYHHYFHGYAGVIAEQYRRGDPSLLVELPGLPPLAVRDLPTFLTESTDPGDYFHTVFLTFRDLFDTLDRETSNSTATILVNSCQELEVGALAAIAPHDVLLLPIGPVLPTGDEETSMFKEEDAARYMEWLHSKPPNSVVYVSFGSLATMAREQVEELLLGLEESGRPYLLVVRKDNRAMLAEEAETTELGERAKNGVVVEWCDQAHVLSHPAVGCFVTHCGWNSVAESVASGVPMVGVPKVSEQSTNARLVERAWRVGVRAQADGGGVLRAAELRRCVEDVMGDGTAAAVVRRMAAEWKRVVAEAMGKGGSSYCNLMAFVDGARSSA
ncbi:cyanidin 3-O-rutinoside 5-O-glucosyltransferase [Sorghum bicolor]|uniref:cyanidin 3-O-rutinoside 5-O-glucosyltransferase n=1 Tax=Sorghum bicolor TaxID=4558 RepID=UPI0001A8991F|nr:cyanidin 3-O-rutinoside 5-O-glucosyltransferase [Sorghum bicolor]|eukprot:XP_002438626.1 cyanidin 3-O-rutinoside 5-O-glucosyltransferase [Sorghum bicolor]